MNNGQHPRHEDGAIILGAGMTGLAAGWASGLPVYEAESTPGGICSSYYMVPGSQERLAQSPENGEAYRFEVGGGHWIFGGDPAILRFIRNVAPVKTYQRVSSVYLPDQCLYVPYTLQNHIGYLNREVRTEALVEMLTAPKGQFCTMQEWLMQSFGPTLTNVFFGPFHELYTAGLWKRIAPQDPYKSPIDATLVIRGASEPAVAIGHNTQRQSEVRCPRAGASAVTPAVGYNPSYLYPQDGLNALAQGIARRCDMRYGKRVKKVDVQSKVVFFDDGSEAPYQTLVSTLPLNRMIEMTGLRLEAEPNPYTSVLVLNIGAVRGAKCPNDHWIYLPGSRAGFHRVGFYSNVDASFLPSSSRASNSRVSIYVERAYAGGQEPSEQEVREHCAATVRELQEWEFIERAEVVDPTWIDVAYTWSRPNSQWRAAALQALDGHDIQMVGRYARWVFQGIADSLRDGLYVGGSNRLGRSR
jgi:protoporphyrinogen oxidase